MNIDVSKMEFRKYFKEKIINLLVKIRMKTIFSLRAIILSSHLVLTTWTEALSNSSSFSKDNYIHMLWALLICNIINKIK